MSLSRAHKLAAQPRTTDITIKDNVTFYKMGLSTKILNGLIACGFEKPSPIQLKAIPLGRCGLDLLIQAKSGTGKTAVFGIIALELINSRNLVHQVLILAPTREIAIQISNVISSLGSEMKGLAVDYFVGGTPLQSDKAKLSKCHILVSTPGRLKHLVDQKLVKIENLKLLVLDEADKLMDESFFKDVDYIFSKLPESKQVILSSATYPDNIKIFTSKYMRMPVVCSPDHRSPVLLGLKQFVVVVPDHPNKMKLVEMKIKELGKILKKLKFKQSLVFFNYQTRAQSVCNQITARGFKSIYITGSQDMKKRLDTMESLKNFKCRILCSTDLTARGIDAENVNLVVNFDVPCDTATYFHRIGRAGRYGAYGIAISLVSAGELDHFRELFESLSVPSTQIYKLPDSFDDIWTADIESFQLFMNYGRNQEDDFNFIKSECCDIDIDNLCEIKRSLAENIEPIAVEDLINLIYKNDKSEILKKNKLEVIEFELKSLKGKNGYCDDSFLKYINYDVRGRKENIQLIYQVHKVNDDTNLFEFDGDLNEKLADACRVLASSKSEAVDYKNEVVVKCLRHEFEFFERLERINTQKTARQIIFKNYWVHLKLFFDLVNKFLYFYSYEQDSDEKLQESLRIKLKNFFSVLEIENYFDSIDKFDCYYSELNFSGLNLDEFFILKKYIILFASNKGLMVCKLLELKEKLGKFDKIMEYIEVLEEINEEVCENEVNTEICPRVTLEVDNYKQISTGSYNSVIRMPNIDEFFLELSLETKKIEVEMYNRFMFHSD